MINSTLEHNIDWPVSEEPKQDFDLYQPSNASERTFKNRPRDSTSATFTPIDHIPHRHFYYYYNALDDRVLPQLILPCQAVLSALFRRSHGFNRNWCQMSMSQLERRTGASRNTIRKHLRTLIANGLICILSEGYHEATIYGLCIPVTIKETGTKDAEPPLPTPACDMTDRPAGQGGRQLSKISDLSDSAQAELDTPMPPDIEEQNPPPSPLSAGEQSGALTTDRHADKDATHTQTQTVRGSIFDRQNLTPCTCTQTCTKTKTGIKPGFHPWQYSRNHVHANSKPAGAKDLLSIPSREDAYLRSLPKKKVGEIYRAQDAWDEILGADTRPTASKLNQMLQYMRGWYRGENLDVKFRWCLADTKKNRPRDAVAWLISALKHGRYPNIVMSKSRGEGTGNSSLKPRPSRPSRVNNPGKTPDTPGGLDRPEQTCEATAEREKRRAASPHRDVWERVLKNIGEKVQSQSFETWFEPLFIAEITDTAIVFDAPDQMVANWVEDNYTGLLKTALKTAGLPDRAIAIEHSKT